MMAEWSKALPLTASCLLPLPWLGQGMCEKVASDLGLGGVFCRVLQFPLPATLSIG